MKGKRFSEEQIIGVLKEAEAGVKTSDLCWRHGATELKDGLPFDASESDDKRVVSVALKSYLCEKAETRKRFRKISDHELTKDTHQADFSSHLLPYIVT